MFTDWDEAASIPEEHNLPGRKYTGIVTGLSHITTYYFRLFAVNDVGQSNPTNTLAITTRGCEYDGSVMRYMF